MTIEFVDESGDFVCGLFEGFEFECMPFRLGERVHLRIANHDKENWDIDDANKTFLITKIDYYLRKDFYLRGDHKSKFTVSITVCEV